MNAQPLLASARAIAKHSVQRLSVGLAAAATVVGVAIPAMALPGVLTVRDTGSWINIRSGPSTTSTVRHLGRAGDRIETLTQQRGTDGYTWYYVQFSNTGAQGWVREDLISLTSGNPTVPAVTTPTTPTTSRPVIHTPPIYTPPIYTPTPSPQPSTPIPTTQPTAPALPSAYTREQIDYFMEVALGSEFGSTNTTVKKWNGPIRIRVQGTPTADDRATLQTVIAELTQLTALDIQLTDRNPNIDLYFVPESQFSRYDSNYRPVNMGFFWTWWSGNTINRARILVTTEGVTQAERSHLIREELTQSLGLMQDSQRYRDSIFYQGWTSTTSYSEMDRAAIALLYNPAIRAGMTRNQVIATVDQINLALQAPRR